MTKKEFVVYVTERAKFVELPPKKLETMVSRLTKSRQMSLEVYLSNYTDVTDYRFVYQLI